MTMVNKFREENHQGRVDAAAEADILIYSIQGRKLKLTRPGSIRSSLRDGLSTPYRLTKDLSTLIFLGWSSWVLLWDSSFMFRSWGVVGGWLADGL